MNRDTRRTRIVLALLLLTSFTLITIDYRGGDDSPLAGLRGMAAAVFGPVQRAAAAVVRPVSDTLGDIGQLGEHEARIDELQRDNDDLRRQLRTSELARNRAAELDALLRVAGAGRYRIVPAQVVAVGPAQGLSWTVALDAGSRDGIRAGMTVLNGDGLVGRVKSVGPLTATVLLVVDPTSAVGVRLEGSMELGTLGGQGSGPLELELFDAQVSMSSGDRIVTFGSTFVPGVPVGEVVAVERTPGTLTRAATVRPYVDFTAIDLVGVVVEPPRRNPRDSLLPPRPSPSATSSPLPSGG